MQSKSTKVDILLQTKLGDTILSLPAILCLKQLIEKYKQGEIEVKLISNSELTKIIKSLNLFDVYQMSFLTKLQSWINTPDKAFFLSTSSKNWGYKGKFTYGIKNSFKKYIDYDNDMKSLLVEKIDENLPAELISFLKEKHHLSSISISIFGVCLELGFTVEQIISTFEFDINSLASDYSFSKWTPSFKDEKYLVFCLEAANNKRSAAIRRWNNDYYLKLAEYAYEKHRLSSVFIGISKDFKIPQKSYFVDLRNKLSLLQLAQLLRFSRGYVGNDTGPLHIANFMKKPTVGVYIREESTYEYSPNFPQLNTVFVKPEAPEEIYSAIDTLK